MHKGPVGNVAGKPRLKFFEMHRKTLMRYVDVAHVAGNMAKNSRAAGQKAIPQLLSFLGLWVLSVPCALIHHCI